MKRTIIIIIIFTIISKLIGFGRDITLSFFFGTSYISDAYLIAFTFPGMIFEFIGASITIAYIPIYNEIQKNSSPDSANQFTSNLITLLMLICTIIVPISILFAEPIVKLLAVGFQGKAFKLAVLFTRISIISVYLSLIISVLRSYLNAKNKFYLPVIVGIPFNIILMLSITIAKKINILFLPIGILIALSIQLIILLISALKEGYSYKIKLDTTDKYLSKMVYMSVPIILGVSVTQLNILIDKSIASQVAIGGISALNYANRLNLFIDGMFVTSIVTPFFAKVSKLASVGEIEEIKNVFIKCVRSLIIILLPITIGTMILSKPIISLLYGRGAFDNQAINMTSSTLFYYSVGFIGFALREVLTKVFYSLKDTKTPVKNAIFSLILNIILNLILSKYMGVGGIALATSISVIIFTILLFINVEKKIGRLNLNRISFLFFKTAIASILMAVGVKVSYVYLLSNYKIFGSLITSIIVGAIVYFLMLIILRIEEANIVKKYLYR